MAELRIQEICKEKGITMQELAHRLGKTYQALYASISKNPTLDRLNEMANALGVEVCELFAKTPKNDELTALINYKGEFYKATTLNELEAIVESIGRKTKQ